MLCFLFKLVLLVVGDDLADEEVDICGIDSPVSSHPPVVIEKDTTYQTSKCSSSGSSGK